MSYNLIELLKEANKFLTMFYPYASYSNQVQIEELVSKLESIIEKENVKTVKIVDSEDVLQKLKEFHGLTDSAVEELQTEIILNEGLHVGIKGDGIQLKTYYLYEVREYKTKELKLEDFVVITVKDESGLFETVNSKKFKSTLPFNLFSTICIVSEVPPEGLTIGKCLPYNAKYFELVPWETDSITWETYQ